MPRRYHREFRKRNLPPWHCYFCGHEVKILEVHHLDENRANNSPENTRAAHRLCHLSHHATGRNNPGVKLTELQVRAIRAELAKWQRPPYGIFSRLARQYGVSHRTIRDIYKRKKWRSLK